ncbi:MAG: hypothetical protein JXI32_07520 [Deltaproteobacteria bacterium]|nr:hypothetical protein [Deltaproteobacteria bacterium]
MFRNRIMIYAVCLMLSLPALFLLSAGARAHSPNDISLRYDQGSRTLSVTISHAVSDPRKHYVKKITITKNGEPVATHDYTSQPEPSPFTYTYPLEAKAGDTLKVTADCNYFGSKTGEIILGK